MRFYSVRLLTNHSNTMKLLLNTLFTTSLLIKSARSFSTTKQAIKIPNFVKNEKVPGLKNGMDYVQLGDSDLVVSRVCMGTMTFGNQNTIDEGVSFLNRCFDEYGLNFLDTAELYPVPANKETQGATDRSVAKFLKSRKREDVILATKVAGRAERMTWMPRREETFAMLTKEQIEDSIEASLERLETDYIDLLQIHWPDRYTGGLFGAEDFRPSSFEETYEKAPAPVPFEEQLGALQKFVKEGKVRYIGVSNETPYGVMSMVNLAKQFPDLYPKIVSIQNNYSLVCRKDYEAGLAEVCYHTKVGLLPYSPLAGGSLTGKYRSGVPEGARLTLFPGFMERYLGSANEAAVNAYCDIAVKAGLSPAELALSWCYHNELVASTIIGATSMEQLDENIKAYDIRLDEDVYEQISKTYKQYTDPTKSR